MQIWPAIDLLGGKCVRLVQGDYGRQKVFGDDPVAVARFWVERGARQLHLVDLDAARDGRSANWPVVRAIVSEVGVPCQLGGGVRAEETIRELLRWGLDRLVIGTSALKQPEWFRSMCHKFPGRLVLGIDARNGCVATDGWQETSSLTATDFGAQFAEEPIAAIVYTDIATDGMLAGPNLAAVAQMRAAVALPLIASGGVTTPEDIARLAQIRMDGCIVGMALYEGRLTMEEALLASEGR